RSPELDRLEGKPSRDPAARRRRERGHDLLVLAAGLPKLDRVSRLHDIGGDVHLPAVDLQVPVRDELPGHRTGRGEPEPEDDVVQTSLEKRQQGLARDAALPLGLPEVTAELGLEDPVDPLHLLLLPKLDAVSLQLAAAFAVLPRRVLALLN